MEQKFYGIHTKCTTTQNNRISTRIRHLFMNHLISPASSRLIGLEIEQKIIQSIKDKTYVDGMQLPSVREMAEELGVNKNTIVRVYQSLHRQGYVQVVQGSGTYVRTESRTESHAADAQQLPPSWQRQLGDALRHAHSEGISQERVERTTTGMIQRIFGGAEWNVLFIECNQYDIDSLGAILANETGQPLQGVLLNDFIENPELYIAKSNLIVTTIFHMSEIEPLVKAVDGSKLVAVNAMPTQKALLDIARLQVPVIGVVADLPRALDNVIHTVKTYQHAATIMSSSLEDKARLHNLLDKADAIVVTPSRYPGLMQHNPQIPVVPISLTISQESITYLQEQLSLLAEPNSN